MLLTTTNNNLFDTFFSDPVMKKSRAWPRCTTHSMPRICAGSWRSCVQSMAMCAASAVSYTHLDVYKRQIRVDKTNRLWYSVLATRLDRSNHVAPEKQMLLQGLLRKTDPPWQSCGAVSGDPQVCRGEVTPSCLRKTALWLKSPTGAFIAAQTPIPPFHSLFSSELWF